MGRIRQYSHPIKSETANEGVSSSVKMKRAKTIIVTRLLNGGPRAQEYLWSVALKAVDQKEGESNVPMVFPYGDELCDLNPV